MFVFPTVLFHYYTSNQLSTSDILDLMNIYFSGIGGVGLGPLAEIAQDAGHSVQGSDPQESPMTKQLSERGIKISTEQHGVFVQACHKTAPIDWFVYSSALPEDHPELAMARMLGIKTSKRDEFLLSFLQETGLKLVAVAGTHGKTGTTAMLAWAFLQLNAPVSYSIGSMVSFGPSGKYDPKSSYFVYECDEYDRNFLQFHPHLAIITSLDYDHPDTYGTPEEYLAAFKQFINQSAGGIMWRTDGVLLNAQNSWELGSHEVIHFKLPGEYTRHNATLVAKALERLGIHGDSHGAIESFPGASRRFEKILPNLYSDYGHHPTEIAVTLQMAREVNEHVVLVYQPHQNLRQHEIRHLYTDCFELAETVYWLPTYLSRENSTLPILTADELTENVTNIDSIYTAELDDELWTAIQRARDEGKLVLFMGAGSIDEWVRARVATPTSVQLLIMDEEGNFVLEKQAGGNNAISTFGDSVEPVDASELDAAMRIIRSHTNLPCSKEDLVYFKTFSRTNDANEDIYVTYYALTGVHLGELKVRQGRSFEKINPNELGNHSLPILVRTAIMEYTRPPLTDI